MSVRFGENGVNGRGADQESPPDIRPLRVRLFHSPGGLGPMAPMGMGEAR